MKEIKNINRYIDHTLLKADATPDDIKKLCDEARKYNFYSVCVNSCNVELAAAQLESSPVKVACVAGFPLGAMEASAKAYEADTACAKGADEIDMVMNIGAMKAGDYEAVLDDMATVASMVYDNNAILKVILETCLLSDAEIVKACKLAVEAQVDFVKTSTGFSTGGATVADVRLMRQAVGDQCKIKASGGIHDYATAAALIEAGADRIGASASIAIVQGAPAK